MDLKGILSRITGKKTSAERIGMLLEEVCRSVFFGLRQQK